MIVPGVGKKYGQAILLAGGAGSGKSFAVSQFIDSSSYKVINPDDVLVMATRIANQGKSFQDIKGLNLSKGKDLAKAYDKIVVKRKLTSKKMKTFLANQRPDMLPNIILDRTFSQKGQFKDITKKLRDVGYKPENIHVVWVLTDVNVALAQNIARGKKGERALPNDILLLTHSGAKANMRDLFFKRLKGATVNGDWYVIFGGIKNTVFYSTPEGELPPKGVKMVIKDFKYLKIKNAGKALEKAGNIARKVQAVFSDILKQSKGKQ